MDMQPAQPERATGVYEPVRLNIGGVRYETTADTLTRHGAEQNLFYVTLKNEGNMVVKDKDGCLFFDRNGLLFAPLLDFLRTGELDIPPTMSRRAVEREADFFQIQIPKQAPAASNTQAETFPPFVELSVFESFVDYPYRHNTEFDLRPLPSGWRATIVQNACQPDAHSLFYGDTKIEARIDAINRLSSQGYVLRSQERVESQTSEHFKSFIQTILMQRC